MDQIENINIGVTNIDTSEIYKQIFENLLSGRQREIFVLMVDESSEYHPGNSNNYLLALAKHFNCSAPAIAKHLRIIRQKIRDALG